MADQAIRILKHSALVWVATARFISKNSMIKLEASKSMTPALALSLDALRRFRTIARLLAFLPAVIGLSALRRAPTHKHSHSPLLRLKIGLVQKRQPDL